MIGFNLNVTVGNASEVDTSVMAITIVWMTVMNATVDKVGSQKNWLPSLEQLKIETNLNNLLVLSQ